MHVTAHFVCALTARRRSTALAKRAYLREARRARDLIEIAFALRSLSLAFLRYVTLDHMIATRHSATLTTFL